MLKLNERGAYRFLPGIAPYSCGVVALEGWEIVHVTLQSPLAWNAGLHAARRFLPARGLVQQNLCGVELRCPKPYSLMWIPHIPTQSSPSPQINLPTKTSASRSLSLAIEFNSLVMFRNGGIRSAGRYTEVIVIRSESPPQGEESLSRGFL